MFLSAEATHLTAPVCFGDALRCVAFSCSKHGASQSALGSFNIRQWYQTKSKFDRIDDRWHFCRFPRYEPSSDKAMHDGKIMQHNFETFSKSCEVPPKCIANPIRKLHF